MPDFLIELESVRDDQKGNFEIHSAGSVSKEGQCALAAPIPYDGEGQSREQTSTTTKTQTGCSLPPTIVHMSRECNSTHPSAIGSGIQPEQSASHLDADQRRNRNLNGLE